MGDRAPTLFPCRCFIHNSDAGGLPWLSKCYPDRERLHSIDPATGELMGTYPIDAEPALQQKLHLPANFFKLAANDIQ